MSPTRKDLRYSPRVASDDLLTCSTFRTSFVRSVPLFLIICSNRMLPLSDAPFSTVAFQQDYSPGPGRRMEVRGRADRHPARVASDRVVSSPGAACHRYFSEQRQCMHRLLQLSREGRMMFADAPRLDLRGRFLQVKSRKLLSGASVGTAATLLWCCRAEK